MSVKIDILCGHGDNCVGCIRCARDHALDEAEKVVNKYWEPYPIWQRLVQEMASEIRALKGKP